MLYGSTSIFGESYSEKCIVKYQTIYAGTIRMLRSTAEAEWVRAPTEI